ncbi:efflux transporter periplasmic adaptor subunit [Thiohalocapsa halophila]|uniref:Efflux transporter periplasmic adaptor subunit n=1 Tax=Thiohalocapsa halophila TaxID=69359 RepID=A0ABS1CJ56_9GAMM|nr:efflux RND transporter periplasmic adaptor subunit [Thiohalocapsa halophila]MBK1631945.1 efflux transporter periplasmic adaptor subunit [Thiohalocapsa halophila]
MIAPPRYGRPGRHLRRRWCAITAVWLWLSMLAALPLAAAEPVGELVPLSADEQAALGIELAAPEPAGAAMSRRYPGKVAVPNRQLRVVAAPQAGVIEALLVAEGERVEAGQVLARLASPELVAVQGDYLEALTRLGLAGSELAREQMLHAEGITAERRIIEAQAKRRELATLVDQHRQRLALAGLEPAAIEALAESRRLSSTLPVRTPIGGVVLEQLADTGESVAASAPLYRIGELSPLWVEVHVPVGALAGVAVGGRVRLPAVGPEPGVDGRIITVGRMVHGEDQGVLVRAEVTAGTEDLRPGQFTEVQLLTVAVGEADGPGRWRLPRAAVVRDAGDAYVFAAADNGFRAVPVTLLAEEDRTLVVQGELSATDQVAVSGVVALKAAWLSGAGASADGRGGDDG